MSDAPSIAVPRPAAVFAPDLLADRTALVTGPTRGIGRQIALALARAGASLVLAARSRADLDAVAAEVRALGVDARVQVTDLRQRADVARLGISDHAPLTANLYVSQGR